MHIMYRRAHRNNDKKRFDYDYNIYLYTCVCVLCVYRVRSISSRNFRVVVFRLTVAAGSRAAIYEGR